jgi:hypothetical protein
MTMSDIEQTKQRESTDNEVFVAVLRKLNELWGDAGNKTLEIFAVLTDEQLKRVQEQFLSLLDNPESDHKHMLRQILELSGLEVKRRKAGES